MCECGHVCMCACVYKCVCARLSAQAVYIAQALDRVTISEALVEAEGSILYNIKTRKTRGQFLLHGQE